MIENNIKAAFNEIHAEQSLKQETKQFIYDKIYNAGNKHYIKRNILFDLSYFSMLYFHCSTSCQNAYHTFFTYNNSFDMEETLYIFCNNLSHI